jgi:hypothetical protein
MLPVAFRSCSAPRPHRIVSSAPNLLNDETPGLARPLLYSKSACKKSVNQNDKRPIPFADSILASLGKKLETSPT